MTASPQARTPLGRRTKARAYAREELREARERAQARLTDLTARELEVLACLGLGLSPVRGLLPPDRGLVPCWQSHLP